MGSIEARLRRLEESGRGGPCPECGLRPESPKPIAVINEAHPDKSFDGDPGERCTRCGRSLYTVLRVVYDEEGEGAVADA
jgi:hypothetical protein